MSPLFFQNVVGTCIKGHLMVCLKVLHRWILNINKKKNDKRMLWRCCDAEGNQLCFVMFLHL